MKGRLLCFLGAAVLLSSCADMMKVRTIRPKASKSSKFSKQKSAANVLGQMKAAKMMSEQSGGQNDLGQIGKAPTEAGVLAPTIGKNVVKDGMLLPSDDTIVWSDGVNPDADIGFDKPFLKPAKKIGPWFVSFSKARRESMRTGKPVMIWFTKSGDDGSTPSPVCKTLQREVFAKNDFGRWANEKVIRLKIDESATSSSGGGLGNIASKKRKYVKKLKKRFSVLGSPTVIMLQPDGAVYDRYRGFKKGHKKLYWGRLKNAVLTISHNYGFWRKKMEKKGYRQWKGKNDQIIFAKLLRYSDGMLTLVEPNGHRIKTSERRLSSKDRAWVIAEKKKRGM